MREVDEKLRTSASSWTSRFIFHTSASLNSLATVEVVVILVDLECFKYTSNKKTGLIRVCGFVFC